MKLRIRGNTIRLRLLKSEVAKLGESGRVAEKISFGPGAGESLTYAVEVSEASDKVSAGMRESEVCVTLPAEVADDWIKTDQVGIEAVAGTGNGSVEILVEKDFACLTRTDDPDNLDAFPNPDQEAEC